MKRQITKGQPFTLSEIRKMQKNDKKVCQKFAESEKVATFATAIGRGNDAKGNNKKGSGKVLKKKLKIFWRFEKLDLSLHPISPQNESRVLKKKV